ncbi:tyrosine-type recombinase/integrase [Amycolatopsis sp. lyj-84]|uniref:tyrosine-type recombinase/integrase n=1 Tax=Amycolatopsis sp. lyj-84 TaxID=2789284 RepID=UPI0039787F8F
MDANGRPVREKTELFGKGERYKVHFYDEAGKERNKSFPDKQLGKAQKFLTKMQHDVLAGEYIDPDAGKITLRVYVKQWLKGQSQDAATMQTVRHRLNARVYPKLGDRPLEVVAKVDTLRDWMEWLTDGDEDTAGVQASYRAQLWDLLSAILEAAVVDKKIRANPCKAKSVRRPKPEQRKIVPWTDAKLHKVQLALPPLYQVMVPLGGGCALRQMEMFGASPDDIDRDALELHVERQIRWIGSVPVFAPPKGGKTRIVPLGEGVLDAIDDYCETFEPGTLTLPWLHPGGDPVTVRVLIDKRQCEMGKHRGALATNVWRGGNFTSDVWNPAVRAAGHDYGKRRDGMHALRHYCASAWLANGVSIKEVAEYLGHHDPGYTLRLYTHLVPSSHKRARLATNKTFKPRRRPDTASDSATA